MAQVLLRRGRVMLRFLSSVAPAKTAWRHLAWKSNIRGVFSGVSAVYTSLRMMTGAETVNGKTVFVTLSLCYSDPYLSQD